jgi:hypothetical protein
MSTRRPYRCTLVLAAATLLGAVSSAHASAPPSPGPASATGLEHRASERGAQIRLAQQAVVNPAEHLGHRAATDAGQACSERLAEAWRGLGHFSDGYETYLLHRPPCR